MLGPGLRSHRGTIAGSIFQPESQLWGEMRITVQWGGLDLTWHSEVSFNCIVTMSAAFPFKSPGLCMGTIPHPLCLGPGSPWSPQTPYRAQKPSWVPQSGHWLLLLVLLTPNFLL